MTYNVFGGTLSLAQSILTCRFSSGPHSYQNCSAAVDSPQTLTGGGGVPVARTPPQL